MSDHIPDVTKMISDTPRTDKWKRINDPIEDLHAFARQLERELNAANDRVERLLQDLRNAFERIRKLETAGDESIYKTNLFDREAHWFKAKEAKP